MEPENPDKKLLPDADLAEELPPGFDRRAFMMRSALVGAAVAAAVWAFSEGEQPVMTAAAPMTALRIMKARRSTPGGKSVGLGSVSGSKASRSGFSVVMFPPLSRDGAGAISGPERVFGRRVSEAACFASRAVGRAARGHGVVRGFRIDPPLRSRK